jgi:UDP-perosamine 4-acetyltransferase
LVLLGAGGHAKVLLALVQALGRQVLGVCDPGLQQARVGQWQGLKVLGADDALAALGPAAVELVLGVGQLARSTARARLYRELSQQGFAFPPLVHPAAWVAADIALPDGAQVMAGAVLQPGATLGRNVIINTRASIDHDCRIGADVHIAPGAVLCGGVQVGDGGFVGAGAVLIQNVQLGPGVIVGAGATVVRDAPAGTLVLGNARPHAPLTPASGN